MYSRAPEPVPGQYANQQINPGRFNQEAVNLFFFWGGGFTVGLNERRVYQLPYLRGGAIEQQQRLNETCMSASR